MTIDQSNEASTADPTYTIKSRVIDMKQLEALKKKLPKGIDLRVSSSNEVTFRVRFRKQGYPEESKTFSELKLAKKWLIEQQRNADAVHEYSTGLSRVEVARNHGVPFTIAPNVGLVEGIDAVRNVFNRCWFDEIKCGIGIKALENYKKEWNDRHGCWSSRPLHNFASHGADAFRMLTVSLNNLFNKGLTIEEWRRLRLEYLS